MTDIQVPTPYYPVYYLSDGKVSEGARAYQRKINDYSIWVIDVGEEGRGRKVGSLIVEPGYWTEEDAKKGVLVKAGSIAKTRSGRYKLIEGTQTSNDMAILVMRTGIGFRGYNNHTGDRSPEWTPDNRVFLPFPGIILAEGRIAQGLAGNMGYGQQYIVLMEKNVWFRTHLTGRMYGQEPTHYYRFNGHSVEVYTPKEREELDLF